MADKNYCDLIYGWMQCKSDWVEDQRVVPASEVKFTKIGAELDMDRRLVSRYVNELVDMGLVEKNESKKYYVLKKLDNSDATLVPYPTLRQLVHSLSRNSVNIFVHLLNRYIASEEQSFIITHKELKERVGIATSTTSNNVIINDILDTLRRLGLVETEIRQTSDSKTHIIVTKVSNVLP